MRVWKRRLHRTLRACRRSFFPVLLVLCMLAGCHQKAVETMTLGEWISLLVQEAALPDAQADMPYFLSVPMESPCYKAVQSAVEWNVLRVEDGFKADHLLSREWVAATLMRLKAADIKAADDGGIVDLAAARFKPEVCACVRAGLMDVDNRHRFYPQAPIDRKEAQALLAEMVNWINTGTVEESQEEIQFTDGQEPIRLDESADIQDGILHVDEKTALKSGDIVTVDEAQPCYRIEEQVDSAHWKAEPVSDLSLLSDLDIESAQELPLEEAWLEETVENAPRGRLAKTVTQQVGDIKLSYSFDRGGMRIHVSKEIGQGARLYGVLSLYGFKPVIRIHMHKQVMETCYMRLDFKTMQSIGIEGKSSFMRYGNQAAFAKNGLKGLLCEKAEPFEITLPITSLRLPLPHLPSVAIKLGLHVSIGCDGQMAMTLTQNHAVGAEIRNHGVRPIYHCDQTAEAGMRANGWLLGGVDTTLSAVHMAIADIAYETGVKTSLSATLHTYDQHGTHSQLKIPEFSGQGLEQAAKEEGILLCTDADAFWVSRLHCNSRATMAGRLGFEVDHDLTKDSAKNRLLKLHGHFENGLLVPHCTRNRDRLTLETPQAVDTQAIALERYSYFMCKGQKLRIGLKALPKGYTDADLLYTVQGGAVSILEDHQVAAKEVGAAIVTIKSRDGQYQTHCTIVVRDGK